LVRVAERPMAERQGQNAVMRPQDRNVERAGGFFVAAWLGRPRELAEHCEPEKRLLIDGLVRLYQS